MHSRGGARRGEEVGDELREREMAKGRDKNGET